MAEIDVYPVGLLQAIKNRHVKRCLKYLAREIRRGEWRAAKNTFNGYLAEPTLWPAGVRRCGSGWTKRRALRSLQRQIERAS